MEVDVYALIASKVFNCDYDDCREFKDGEPYLIGQTRRKLVKDAIAEVICGNKVPRMMNLIENYFSGITEFCEKNRSEVEFYKVLSERFGKVKI